jgi:hypothetical protein
MEIRICSDQFVIEMFLNQWATNSVYPLIFQPQVHGRMHYIQNIEWNTLTCGKSYKFSRLLQL